jgi:hypothetical protein
VSEEQLDLFSDAGVRGELSSPRSTGRPLVLADMEDEVLIAAIAEASLAEASALAAEAARRRLAAAVPALAALCRRFAGFGSCRMVPEQAAALRALATIGTREAAHAVSQLIERAVVRGPALTVALSVVAQLHATLSG